MIITFYTFVAVQQLNAKYIQSEHPLVPISDEKLIEHRLYPTALEIASCVGF